MQMLRATKSQEHVEDEKLLAYVHNQLAGIVSPATPRTIVLLQTEKSSRSLLNFLGPVKLVRRMMFIAIIFLISFVAISLSPEVSSGAGDLLKTSGIPLLLNELFFMSAAGLGATFSGLYLANTYVANGTYDPKYEASYWIRMALGIIAGLILASLITLDPSGESPIGAFGKPILALLGGFSANLVYDILLQIIATIESFMRGDTMELIALRAEIQEKEMKNQLTEEFAQTRHKIASSLMKLQREVTSELGERGKEKDIDGIFDDIFSELLDLESGEGYIQEVIAHEEFA